MDKLNLTPEENEFLDQAIHEHLLTQLQDYEYRHEASHHLALIEKLWPDDPDMYNEYLELINSILDEEPKGLGELADDRYDEFKNDK